MTTVNLFKEKKDRKNEVPKFVSKCFRSGTVSNCLKYKRVKKNIALMYRIFDFIAFKT